MKRIIKTVIIVYLLASLALSVVYNLYPGIAWEIATHRNGLLIVGIEPYTRDYWLLNPLDNYGDGYLIGVCQDGETGEYRAYHDGFGTPEFYLDYWFNIEI